MTLPGGRSIAFRLALLALALRVAVVAFAAGRFPPVDDAAFYQTIAGRLARGLGYTWAWPDGTVTFAANYPIGYPALLAGVYAVGGVHVGLGMLLNAVVGAAATYAAVGLASRVSAPSGSLLVGLVAALEPALVFYTPALMTESVAGELLVIAAAIATAKRPGLSGRIALGGAVVGVATLVRPELVLLAPCVGALAVFRLPRPRLALAAAGGALAVALVVCAPWTLRNCARLDRCSFVSANAGQNLLIGTSALGRGGWVSLDTLGVPFGCRAEFGEGGKDRCFGRAALAVIAERPFAWLALVPRKLGMTFDYGTAAAYYLSTSNPRVVGERAKIALGAGELLGQRALLGLGLWALGRAPGPHARARRRLLPLGLVLCVAPFAWVAFLALVVEGALLGKSLLARPPALLAVAVVFATAVTHALFFGAGRYSLVCLPALSVLPGLLFPAAEVDTQDSGGLLS
ncbi:MAG TPA: hypothetical protein VGQ57_14840 [Polyangiaceae bacterium]|nr:hypothetical protein [Polyangiaceae bacterium]